VCLCGSSSSQREWEHRKFLHLKADGSSLICGKTSLDDGGIEVRCIRHREEYGRLEFTDSFCVSLWPKPDSINCAIIHVQNFCPT